MDYRLFKIQVKNPVECTEGQLGCYHHDDYAICDTNDLIRKSAREPITPNFLVKLRSLDVVTLYEVEYHELKPLNNDKEILQAIRLFTTGNYRWLDYDEYDDMKNTLEKLMQFYNY